MISRRLLTGMLLVLAMCPLAERQAKAQPQSPPAASPAPIPGKIGDPLGVALSANQGQEFDLDLPAGQFLVLCDGQAAGDKPRIVGSVSLLKRDGTPLPGHDGEFVFWNQNQCVWREGGAFKLAKPTELRLRLKNTADGPSNYWLHVAKLPAEFVPFGFALPVTPCEVGQGKGTNGTLAPGAVAYGRATIPAGKWNISLGAQAQNARAYASLITLDARGMAVDSQLLIAATGEMGALARKAKSLSFSKPTPLLFRIWNEGAADKATITYTVTIEPAT